MSNGKNNKLTKDQKKLLEISKRVAIKLGSNNKELTGLIGELSACDVLNMKWEPSKGYDCVGSNNKKVEIKTRRDSKGGKVNKRGRLGRFEKKGRWDFAYGLYVELNGNFEVTKINKMNKEKIKKLEQSERGRGLHISTFLKNSKPVYPTFQRY